MKQHFSIFALMIAAWRGSPLLMANAMVMIILAGACFIFGLLDDRLIAGASVWAKPFKFYISIAVLAITMAWASDFLREPKRGVKIANITYLVASWLELIYITYRGFNGEASHFNTSTPTANILYGIMGAVALVMTGSSGYVGWVVFRHRKQSLIPEAAGVGLMLGAVLGTTVGFYLGGNGGHWVGGDLTDATGLPFFNWSTTGGDLRISHFFGLHAAQFLPFAALSLDRRVIYGVAGLVTLVTFATMAQAIMGIPLFRA